MAKKAAKKAKPKAPRRAVIMDEPVSFANAMPMASELIHIDEPARARGGEDITDEVKAIALRLPMIEKLRAEKADYEMRLVDVTARLLEAETTMEQQIELIRVKLAP